MHENKILSELDHPNIVKVYGIKKYKGINYLVMEYMNGGSLLDFIRKYEKSLQEQDFFQMSLQIALGMEYLGTKNVLHRFKFIFPIFISDLIIFKTKIN